MRRWRAAIRGHVGAPSWRWCAPCGGSRRACQALPEEPGRCGARAGGAAAPAAAITTLNA